MPFLRSPTLLIAVFVIGALPASAQTPADSALVLRISTDAIRGMLPENLGGSCVSMLDSTLVATPGGQAGTWTPLGAEVMADFASHLTEQTSVRFSEACPSDGTVPAVRITPYRIHFDTHETVDLLLRVEFSWGRRSVRCLGRRNEGTWNVAGSCEVGPVHERVP